MNEEGPKPRYATAEEDAEGRFQKYKAVDPFPTIPPALLNRADIADYVAATGMIVPFDESALKPASYGIRLGGKCVYWDANEIKHVVILSSEAIPKYKNINHVEELILERNSIVFVSLEPFFRIPHYIALRFNLKIQNVYRGLLLGTGPLVDPGFRSKLSFPLHNLTNEEYVLRAGEVFIYLEFTKVSGREDWYPGDRTKDLEEREGKFEPLEARKLERLDVMDYLHHANQGRPVRSSIPIEISQARSEAENAQKSSDKSSQSARESRNKVESIKRRLTLSSIVGGVITLIVILLAGYQLWTSINQLALQGFESTNQLRIEFEALKARLERDLPILNIEDVKNLETDIREFEDDLEDLRSIVNRNDASQSLVIRDFETTAKLRAELEALKARVERDLPGVLVSDVATLEAKLKELEREIEKIKERAVDQPNRQSK